MDAPELRDNPERSRYEALVDGTVAGYADYTKLHDLVVFPHTVVRDEYGGRGIASQLAQFALDDVAATGGLKVVPVCSFFVGFIAKHPEYAGLVYGSSAT